MDLEVLKKIGLSNAEIKVYLALLELGITTVGQIIKKSGIPSSNIYPILESLINKGLISYTISANKRYFKAEDPNRLKEFLNEQKEQLNNQEKRLSEVILGLRERQEISEKPQESFTYEGIKGIKTALEFVLKILKKGDTFMVVDASEISNEILRAYFNDFSKRRAMAGIKYKIIYGTDLLKFAEIRKKDKLTEARILPKEVKIPSISWIFGEYVVIAVFSEHPVALMIKNKQVSEGFNANFKILWNMSKEL